MEKELLGSFAVAEKAAAAAAMADGGSADEDRCLDALKRMKRMPVTTKDLVATQVGKRIRGLTKHPNRRIQEVATDLFKFWKNVVIQETSKEVKESSSSDDRKPLKTKSNSERSDATNVDKTSNSDSSKSDVRLKSKSFEAEKSPSDKCLISEKFSRSETVKIETSETTNGIQTIKVERLAREQKQVSSATKHSIANGPLKLASMIKCNDPLRDKLRELLAEAFSRVSVEASEDDREEVRNFVDEINACDPIRVAIIVESMMFEKLGKSNGTHKVKYRSIMFNLKDAKNTDLRRRVLLGHIVPEKLVSMTAEEMASDERKMANKQIQEKALFECERGAAPKATTDQFKCGRCGQRKCTYYQLQTRSADEPMTTFVTCVNCNNHWKFC